MKMVTHQMQLLLLLLFVVAGVKSAVIIKSDNPTTTIVTTQNITSDNITEPKAYIDFKILHKPHHLFIGRCNPDHDILHAENIILNNDGKSHVNATIRFNIEAEVNITCIKVLDQVAEGDGGYPSFMDGGVGFNYVVIGVTTNYGKGFDFYVQIYGLPIKKEPEPQSRISVPHMWRHGSSLKNETKI